LLINCIYFRQLFSALIAQNEVITRRANCHLMSKNYLLPLILLSSICSINVVAQPVTFSYTGRIQTYLVPKDVTSLAIDMQGASGGAANYSRGGNGGRLQCALTVTPGTILYFNIGGSGSASTTMGARGGYNGGGTGSEDGGGGGGASDIRYGGSALANRVVVAGGGGGACGAASVTVKNYTRGGDGGSPVGESGYSNGKSGAADNYYAGIGGANTFMRYNDIRSGAAGKGGDGYGNYAGGGGGGGGYFGGNGGDENGGGGGGSYTDPVLATSVVHTRGFNAGGNGAMTIEPVLAVVVQQHEILATDKQADADKIFVPHGTLYGSAFSDFAYKSHADTVLEGRSGISQYSKVAAGTSQFQFRRIHIGYNYDISQRFSTEFLLAAEDDYNQPLNNSAGDLLANGKFAPFIKLANLRWKNVFKGADIVIGQQYTPAFHATTEEAWAYRSIARTLTDIYRTNEYDMGISIQGHLPTNDNFGYNLMVGNGSGAMPEANAFKWFYGDVYYKFLDKRMIVDFFADYEKLTWTSTWHRDRQMNKILVAYSVPKYTIGVEAFVNRLMADDIATRVDGVTIDTITTKRAAVSVFVHGRIYGEKLGFFARYDQYDWGANNSNANAVFASHNEQTNYYDHNTKQEMATLGLDFCPYTNVHIMPNLWYNYYENTTTTNLGTNNVGYDLVYRLTVSYKFTK